MEKKVIDLRDCKEDVEIILPNKFRWENKQDDKGEYIGIRAIQDKDPFSRVPKDIEALFHCHGSIERRIEAYDDEDGKALAALATLRRFWHEWTHELGTAETHHKATSIVRDGYSQVLEAKEGIISGALVFKEYSHAEKFIECFPELLEKAKILL